MASVIITFNNQEQGTHELNKPKMVVGREAGCEICIDNLGISRQHCAFVNKNGAFVVQDLGSSNGTFVNQKRIVEHFLNDGDEIVIGKYVIRFKNEQQVQAVEKASNSPVPDTLNTYVMDSNKIQEQLAKMKAQQQGGGGGAGGETTPAPKNTSVLPKDKDDAPTAKDYAKAMGGGTPEKKKGCMGMLLLVATLLSGMTYCLMLFLNHH